MKPASLFFVVAIVLLSCRILTFQTHPSIDPTVDINAISTAAFQTAMVMVGNAQTMTASASTTDTPTYLPTPFPTLTPYPNATPFPVEIESLLQDKCTFGAPVAFYGFAERYGDKGCILPTFSPDKNYLAYVTLDEPQNQDKYVDTVKVLATATGKVQTVHFAHELNLISNLEWTPTGQLIIQESIWEGAFFIVVYDPVANSTLTTMRLNRASQLKWNRTHTAFYAEHSHGYGAGVCIRELRGYDFIHNNPFPDFYELFHIEKQEQALLGIPNGKTDDLAIEPFAWSQDGTRLWVTITFLRQTEDGLSYELGPKQAGVLELDTKKVAFTMLSSDADLDYSFENLSGTSIPKIVSSSYQPRRCP